MHDLIRGHLLRVHEVGPIVLAWVHGIRLGEEIWVGVVHGLLLVMLVHDIRGRGLVVQRRGE